MSTIVDARGLSCPQPVLMTLNRIKKGDESQLTVWVDTQVSRENVTRMAQSQGWSVENVQENENSYKITIKKL